jgi:hypothetical protein
MCRRQETEKPKTTGKDKKMKENPDESLLRKSKTTNPSLRSSMNRSPLRHVFGLLALALASFELSTPKGFGVVPAPDGGYPGFTTAEGQSALLQLTTGSGNTAVGWFSLESVTTGSFNTGVGAGTLVLNTGDNNTATGTGALLSNTAGVQNTANGAFTLLSNTEGSENTAAGFQALLLNTTGSFNTANGVDALSNNTIGSSNTAAGFQALLLNTTGSFNTANGINALSSNTTGSGNTALGESTLLSNTDGVDNTATGDGALHDNTTGSFNTATGDFALLRNTIGEQNTADGSDALLSNTVGFQNTADGGSALLSNTTGINNTATGFQALTANTTGGFNTASGINVLANNTTGSSNTAIGDSAGFAVTTADHVICIGANVQGENVSNTCYIGNIFGVTSSGGTGVFVNPDGKLGTTTSSRRFKEQIKPMERASESLFALNPVTFRYKKQIDPKGLPQFGLVAEDVEKVNPNLVVRDKEGRVNTVRYDVVNAMLLNEFLKEHRKVEQQEMRITELSSRATKQDAIIAQQQKSFQSKLNEQEKQIAMLISGLQKVSAQLATMSGASTLRIAASDR